MMKKLLLISQFLLFGYFGTFAQTYTIPDSDFSSFLNSTYPTIMSGSDLDIAGAAAVTGTLNCSNLDIADLSGIEYFTGISELLCQNNQLSSLDLSANTALVRLNCDQNQLSAISGLSNLTALEDISCRLNSISDLSDLAGLANLTRIWAVANPLTSFPSFTNFPDLEDVNLGNHNTSNWSIDLSSCTKLEIFRCKDADIVSISGLANTPNLFQLDVSNNAISDLNDLDGHASMIFYLVSNNELTTMPDLSSSTGMKWIKCGHNPYDPWTFDVSPFTDLELLDVKESNLNAIDGLGTLSKLTYLDVSLNNISSIMDLTNSPNLTDLIASSNNLERLPDLTGYHDLDYVKIGDNRLDFSDYKEFLIIDQLPSMSRYDYDGQKEFYGYNHNQVTCLGQTIVLRIDSQKGADYYQWFHNGNPVANAFDTALEITISSAGDFGTYYCKTYGSTLDYPADMSFPPGLYEFKSVDFLISESDVPCTNNCKGNKVEICHIPPGNPDSAHTICVSANAVEAHLAHGDQLGPCGTSGPGGSKPAFVYNSPNPFSGETTITYFLPKQSDVVIQIIDMKGEVKAEYNEGTLAAGVHELVYSPEASGVYTVLIILNGNEILTSRLIAKKP